MKKIIFIPGNEETSLIVEPPIPAKKLVPDWYKKIPVDDKKKPVFHSDNELTLGLKACLPFFDAMAGGYIQKTWADIYVGCIGEKLHWGISDQGGPFTPLQMSMRGDPNIEITDNYYPIEFLWIKQWSARLPKGYSLLLTHPHNRLDLPFYTLSGIIDADSYYHSPQGNIPFYIQKGFQGFIPAGTPMFQLIPIKREGWESEIETFNKNQSYKLAHKMRKNFQGVYRNNFWHKKTYN